MTSSADLDALLTLQLAVAWAGESGEEPRLGWWTTRDLHAEYGGLDLFRRLTPHTAPWAALQAVREAARRTDAALRARAHDPDRLVSLFRFGFTLDEQLDERLAHHKRSGTAPTHALPALSEVIADRWDRDRFDAWARRHGPAVYTASPAGRQLNEPPDDPARLGVALVGALHPLGTSYPLPHVRRP